MAGGNALPRCCSICSPVLDFFTVPAGTARVLPTSANARELKLESRSGLKAIAKPTTGGLTLAATRQPVYEKVRLIPQDIDLVVALDGQLERVERVDATSALAGIPFVTSIRAGGSTRRLLIWAFADRSLRRP